MLLLDNIATSVKISEAQLPRVHRLLVEAATTLQMDAPELYVRQHPLPNAYTLAIAGRKPFIVIHTALLELLTPRELQARAACVCACVRVRVRGRVRAWAWAQAAHRHSHRAVDVAGTAGAARALLASASEGDASSGSGARSGGGHHGLAQRWHEGMARVLAYLTNCRCALAGRLCTRAGPPEVRPWPVADCGQRAGQRHGEEGGWGGAGAGPRTVRPPNRGWVAAVVAAVMMVVVTMKVAMGMG